MSDLKAKIHEHCKELEEMIRKGEYTAAVEKFYAEDAKLMTPEGGCLNGRKEVEAMFREHNAKDDPWNMCIEDVQGEGGWAFLRGSFKAQKFGGKYLTVWKKQGDRFVIYADMFSISK